MGAILQRLGLGFRWARFCSVFLFLAIIPYFMRLLSTLLITPSFQLRSRDFPPRTFLGQVAVFHRCAWSRLQALMPLRLLTLLFLPWLARRSGVLGRKHTWPCRGSYRTYRRIPECIQKSMGVGETGEGTSGECAWFVDRLDAKSREWQCSDGGTSSARYGLHGCDAGMAVQ